MSKLKNLRYERKFVISELHSYEIENLIKHHPAMFSEIFYERRVNNIYLDSMGRENYQEHLAGASQRLKIRIRWYGKVFGIIKNPILELKIKKNELGKKSFFQLKPFILDKDFSVKLLQKVFLKSDLPKWLIEKLRLYHPTLLNSYKRKYFISFDKKHRITLDKNQIFFKIKDIGNSFKERIANNDSCVLEVKYSLKDYKKAANIMQKFPFRLTANSKYLSGIDLFDI